MVLKSQVEWALHCCSILAAMPPDKYIPTKDLAEFHGVPKEYLSKALQALAQAKLIEGTLGPAGGYRLSRKPKEISFLEVVEAVEGRQATFNCTEIRKNNPCLRSPKQQKGICAVARTMQRADEAWRNELRSTTIDHLMVDVSADVPADVLAQSHAWFTDKKTSAG